MKGSGDVGFFLYPGTSEDFQYYGFCLLCKKGEDVYCPSRIEYAGNGFWPSPPKFFRQFPVSANEFDTIAEYDVEDTVMTQVLAEASIVIQCFFNEYEFNDDPKKEQVLRSIIRVIRRYAALFTGEVALNDFSSGAGFQISLN